MHRLPNIRSLIALTEEWCYSFLNLGGGPAGDDTVPPRSTNSPLFTDKETSIMSPQAFIKTEVKVVDIPLDKNSISCSLDARRASTPQSRQGALFPAGSSRISL